MRITPAICSGLKATPSTLYKTDIQAFSLILKTATSQPILFNKATYANTSDTTNQTLVDSAPTLKTSGLTGQFLLAFSTCFSDTDGDYSASAPFTELWTASGATDQRLAAGFIKNATPATNYVSGFSHTTSVTSPHDHLTATLEYHSSEAILFDELAGTDTFTNKVNTASDRISLTLPSDQAEDDVLIVAVMHRFPLSKVIGWDLDFTNKITSIDSLSPPYYKDQYVSVFSKVVPSTPIGQLIIDVVNSTGTQS